MSGLDCAQLSTGAVAMVNSGTMHSFISSPGQSTSVTLADGSSSEATEMCVVPLVFCSDSGFAV